MEGRYNIRSWSMMGIELSMEYLSDKIGKFGVST